MAYDVGQTVRVPVTVTDVDGDPTDATMAIEVTKPDGTTSSPAITNDGVGLYHADITTDAPGTWLWKYSASGAVLPAVYTGQFFVRTPGPRIVSLREAKEYLNKNALQVQDDEELRDFIDMTTVVLETIKGPIVPRTVTEYQAGGKHYVFLRRRPVLSITSVQEVWGPDDVRTLTAEPDLSVGATTDQYVADLPRGRLRRRDSGFPACFPYGVANVKIVYRVGQSPIQPNVRQAGLNLLAHFWRSTQLVTGRSRPRSEFNDETLVASYGVPESVRKLLGDKRAPRLGA